MRKQKVNPDLPAFYLTNNKKKYMFFPSQYHKSAIHLLIHVKIIFKTCVSAILESIVFQINLKIQIQIEFKISLRHSQTIRHPKELVHTKEKCLLYICTISQIFLIFYLFWFLLSSVFHIFNFSLLRFVDRYRLFEYRGSLPDRWHQ